MRLLTSSIRFAKHVAKVKALRSRAPAVLVAFAAACGGSDFSTSNSAAGSAGHAGSTMTTGGSGGGGTDASTGGNTQTGGSGGTASGGSSGSGGGSGSGSGGRSGSGGSSSGGTGGGQSTEGGTVSPEGQPISTDKAVELCSAYQDHATSCMWTDVPNVDWNCGDASLVWNADAFTAFATCVTELPCDGDGQTCVASTIDAVSPTDAALHYADTCTARYTECGFDPLIVEGCKKPSASLYTDAIIDQFTSCFSQLCDQIAPCLESTL